MITSDPAAREQALATLATATSTPLALLGLPPREETIGLTDDLELS